jgi:hypothetical protein
MRVVTALVFLGVLLTVTGCGPGEVAVSGSVTLDGKPLEEGNIAYRPLPAKATAEATGVPIRGGKYQLKVRPGQYRIEITATRAAPGPKDPFGTTPPPKSIIPQRYNAQSELTEEVGTGTNEFNFTLKSR